MRKVITITRRMGLMGRMGLIGLIGLMSLMSLPAQAQIVIGGNVYGGGNKGTVVGNTTVTVLKVDTVNKVFGGARQADVGGRTFVNIDGKHATGNIMIADVYGGNDVAGTIGQSGEATTVPEELENVLTIPEPTEEQITAAGSREKYIENYKKEHPKLNAIDNTWKTFVATSRSKNDETDKENKWILIGSVFGGGNGDFIYTDAEGNPLKDGDDYIVNEVKTINGVSETITIARKATPFVHPDIDKTYLELKGGELAHVYGGGNRATVRQNTTINIDNESEDCQEFVKAKATELLTSDPDRITDPTAEGPHTFKYYANAVVNSLKSMAKLSTFQSDITSFAFNHARVFGGNNKAEMAIRPTWNLQQGVIRDLYSGGNQGDMTSPEGLLLELAPDTAHNAKELVVENVYGGCRMADVRPTVNGVYTPCSNLSGYYFPPELSARVLVRGGHINNVYGGNDITGKVFGGNAIGIYTTVYGDVYGGGNGAYAYTNQSAFANSDVFGDFYYIKGNHSTWLDALNAHRPNAEQVSIRLAGNGPGSKMTMIKGSVFVGGNCASLATVKSKPLVELKIGSYVIADKVFLGNNGEKMIDPTILSYYSSNVDEEGTIVTGGGTAYSTDFSLTTPADMAAYMDGAAMPLQPRVTFDDAGSGDPATYLDNTSYVGSFYCGGNVGSMTVPGTNTYSIDGKLNIFEKFVGGCNNAYVPVQYLDEENKTGQLNAAYDGGILGNTAEQANYWDVADVKMKDRLEINLDNLTITPLRWDANKTRLIWNTQKWFDDDGGTGFREVPNTPVDSDTRLLGGNVYGGCYNSGHVNGNVTININEDVLKRSEVFGNGTGPYGRKASGIELKKQRDDLMAMALSVFGAGYGEDTEIWGSTTVNLNKGYVFQVYGGGELGVVGKKTIDGSGNPVLDSEGNYTYAYSPAYSSTVNLKGLNAGYADTDSTKTLPLAETEYIYGGGNEGDVCGDTYVYLGNGRIYDAFGGASDADILGHTELYIGRQPDGNGGYQDGFPWIRDIVYGGNDFGGTIHGTGTFKDKVRVETGSNAFDVLGKVHNPDSKDVADVLQASTYVEYRQGRVDSIYGGSYGNYNYTLNMYKDDEGNAPELPSLKSSFVNIRPNAEYNADNRILGIFGAGTGYTGNRNGDRSQDRSYVLIDIPDNLTNFRTTEIFGAGSYNGLGMNSAYDAESHKTVDAWGDEVSNLDNLSAIIDLVRGKVGAAYGGSFMEGVTRRTMVNVPSGSTINIGSIFGGAYGNDLLAPCDVYEAHVNYSSADALLVYNPGNALMRGSIYGGNNTCRRTIYGFVDINSKVRQDHPVYGITRATVYGAGYGPMTWSEYTEVNLNRNGEVFEVYGGAQNGEVLNAESAKSFMNTYLSVRNLPTYLQTIYDERGYNSVKWENEIWPHCWTIGKGYYYPYTESGTFDVDTKFDGYSTNEATNLSNPLTRTAEMDDRDYSDARNQVSDRCKYNTNVIIHDGAYVANYAYGGGLGISGMSGMGDVYGTTYIALLGGEVRKDIYAAGTAGVVFDNYNSNQFIASSNAYIKGGMCRNVYGGGWEGSVGKHIGDQSAPYYDFTNNKPLDVPGETHVVIGDIGEDKTFADGRPAILRNVYGGGEGGSVYGTTHLTINNGMIGYRYKNTGTDDAPVYEYVEELDDKVAGDNALDGSGNAFGGGYILNSYVDDTSVKMFGGTIRGSLFGGGEVGPVGRGTVRYKDTYTTQGLENGIARIFKAGKTHVEMYNGHVLRNVFGGGRGKDSWEGDGTYSMDPAVVATLDHDCKGFVFGQTEVDIYGGEVGTNEGMARSFGNVFGGGDEGTVISAYEKSDHTLAIGKKWGNRYDGSHEGYYFKYEQKSDGSYDYVTEGTGTDTRNVFTEDCKVLVEPWLQVTKEGGIDFDADGDDTAENYPKGSYIPTAYLNTLESKSASGWPTEWGYVDVGTAAKERGVIIHNAVFAGGNVAYGSSSMSADEKTVFGNATASIHDAYNRDFITIGTGYTGGLYGDGNLTLVDGYRELNITNYGTDKNHLADQLTKAQYDELPPREQAYYEVKYKCIAANGCTDQEGNTYKKDAILPRDELMALFTYEDGTSVKNNASGELVNDGSGTAILTGTPLEPNPAIWQENGVVSTYAGRIMNTIQRADFCGVFGSRMVMKGARDRVTNKEDKKNYTINRVREVSLNKMKSQNANDTLKYTSGEHNGEYQNPDAAEHGNYFGIYSNVNYFGALTSDVDFHKAVRTTKTDDAASKGLIDANYGTTTFAQWKEANRKNKNRNNGNCHNQLALASGVYLELTTEKSTGTELSEKDWGLITGVVELDLINVQTGIGGGYVYAKNEHGQRIAGHQNTTLTALNKNAVSQWNWGYETADAKREEWETSGNFIHSSQTIIDDCYNESARYKSTDGVPAHYWFISGSVYVYDQYITAHTGASNAFSEKVELPITINAAANGKMTLMDVQPNLYAYYSSANKKLGANNKVVINNIEYKLNDPITYWEWFKLPLAERKLFVEDTYVVVKDCKIGSKIFPKDTVLLKSDYDALSSNTTVKKLEKDEDGNYYVPKDEDNNDITMPFTDAFRSSNNLSHDTGYMLTYSVTNPEKWQPWYTEIKRDSKTYKITTAEYSERPKATTTVEGVTTLGQEEYYDGPTYTPTTTGLYGQKKYDVNDIIPKEVFDTYKDIPDSAKPNYGLTEEHADYDPDKVQATFVPAYVVTKEYIDDTHHYYPGAPVSESIGTTLGSTYASPAFVCTSTIEVPGGDYIYVNELMTAADITKLKAAHSSLTEDINKHIVPAYYCTSAGLYGGDVYVEGKNYRALGVWSSMTEAERANFSYNYDALDLLIDPDYGKDENGVREKEGQKYQYDSADGDLAGAQGNKATYSLPTPIDYTATYNGSDTDHAADDATGKKYFVTTSTEIPAGKVYVDEEYSRKQYESLPNEQRHYSAITVKPEDVAGEKTHDVYVVNEGFVHIETPYAAGATIAKSVYDKLTTDEQSNITKLTFKQSDLDKTVTEVEGVDTTTYNATTFHYCREGYKVNEKGGSASAPTSINITGATGGVTADSVKAGTIISNDAYTSLPNQQKNFTIHGKSPMETSTLYVSRFSDVRDLSQEKIITVIYKYDYEESDESGLHVTPVSERHVVNIHIRIESGEPTVPDIQEPDIVLPGTSVSMKTPVPVPGTYEVTGGGWELFDKASDADSHINGKPYTPSRDSLYWYQDGFLIAYYAKTQLGKTYSNAVPVHVANYHDLKGIMDDKKYHLHVDYDRTRLKRESKVYINNYTTNDPATSKNGLDLLKDFYDLSLVTSSSSAATDGYTVDGDKVTATTGTANSNLTGHSLLNTATKTTDNKTVMVGVKAATNLEFFLRTDIDHSGSSGSSAPSGSATWTPIGNDAGTCFNGTLHGDGHTISGLNPATGTTGSLFGHLCGNVYNLGVTGSFTGGGIADTGEGYVESCWVKSTATSGSAAGTYAVFGNPTDNTGFQVVNSYFWDGNTDLYNTTTSAGVTTSGGDRGKARAMTAKEFYNGTVAYDLNNFYLYKRYSDHTALSGSATEYKYWQPDNDTDTPNSGKYVAHADLCSSGVGTIKYVEDRYFDGDFRFAGGTIPTTVDDRHYLEDVIDPETNIVTKTNRWAPIWPDDYLFFGQMLNYGYSDTEAHQPLPSAIVKNDNNRLPENAQNNRVYRAPAYFGDHLMDMAHFNPTVYLAQTKKGDAATEAYPGMTAIDFRGHNDVYEANGAKKAYGSGAVTSSSGIAAGTTLFYPPLLDDDGLLDITNVDETKNLLVYAPAAGDNAKTHAVLTDYFVDPDYDTYYDNSDGYRLVRKNDKSVYGHLVQSNLTATNDHLLVDKEDFNCPIAYNFQKGSNTTEATRMWYQRIPEETEYVTTEWSASKRSTKGWQGVSLPFTAELVTTSDKGEITHFYGTDDERQNSKNGTGTKIAHEYWLREFKNGGKVSASDDKVYEAKMNYPDAAAGGSKNFTNTFLWDYYYKNELKHNRQDANEDTYQTYYNTSHNYSGYPLLTAAKPYIIGLPGVTFYEFDLSGSFEAQNTKVKVPKLGQQIITFASDEGAEIKVSDTELNTTGSGSISDGSYIFKANYKNQELPTGTYVMNSDGNAYHQLSATAEANTTNKVSTALSAFRPYFVATANGARAATRSIVFVGDEPEANGANEPKGHEAEKPGTLIVSSGKHKVIVKSTLNRIATVSIVNTAGITLSTFDIEPGETIETRVNLAGVYMVQTADGKYIKKITVR